MAVRNSMEHIGFRLDRRTMLGSLAAAGCSLVTNPTWAQDQANTDQANKDHINKVQTVLGSVPATALGVTLMHEHAPTVDWSELYETTPAPIAPIREKMLADTAELLNAFHRSLSAGQGPGAIVEATPIRVGRYPLLLVDLAKRTSVHIIAATGFWCEAMAPQHPWAVRLSVERDGIEKIAALFIREITQGMEDPTGKWNERFTDIKAGIIKIGTSTYLRPSERACHIAAAIASKQTGCPITTHTTKGGGLEEAELLLKHGAAPDRVIIGHQGFQDDRQNDEADDYHRLIAKLGCYVQFDRIDHADYGIERQTRQIRKLIESGFVKQILVSHDHVPYFCPPYAMPEKRAEDWKALKPDYRTVTSKLVPSLRQQGVSEADIKTILLENPQRVLAFVK